MAYTSANMSLQAQAIAGPRRWTYFSTDAVATVVGANYFSDGDALGMKTGDMIDIVDTDASPIDGGVAIVTAVTAGGAATAEEYQAITT